MALVVILIAGFGYMNKSENTVAKRSTVSQNGMYHFDTVPPALEHLKNLHPRLYMTAQSRDILRARMTSPAYANLSEHLKTIADGLAAAGPPAYTNNGDEQQLWLREVGNDIPELAMAYSMTGDVKYFNAAKSYMLTSALYPTWGLGSSENSDLATGHMLYGMAIGYDWLYQDLDPVSRDIIRSCLVKRGARMYDILLHDRIYWTNRDLQNHQYICMAGLAASGFALFGDTTDVDGWILLPLEKFRKSISSLQPDGSNHEGIPYWEYAIEYLMKFMDLSRDLLGVDLYAGNLFFQNTASFRLYGMIPKDYWEVTKSRVMTLGDSPRTDWYGPDYLLRKLASENNDGYAQWLAEKLDSSGYSVPKAEFLNLLWFNPLVKPKSPASLPLYKHFNDLDIVYMRSGWDGKEALTLFKCGPFIGHSALSKYNYDPGGGHVHPDVGTFQIFSHGDWLLTDEGYAFKKTVFQNTLMVNGAGQIGEGKTWFDGSLFLGKRDQPRIVYSRTGVDYDYVIGDAQPAYSPASHLTAFYRHIMFLKPNCWVIADEVASDSASLFEFYYHSDFTFISDSINRFRAQGTRGGLRVTLLKPQDAATETFLQDIQAIDGRVSGQLNVLKVSTSEKKRELFITVLEAYPNGKAAEIKSSIKSSSGGNHLIIVMNNKSRIFKIMSERKDKNTPLFINAGK